ncbi:hypothetical protein A2765_05295 [Candidatus Kaiserbacteria bacterium RIFCSPHIGHO2_01_FULL_56_24]|uniref:DUF4230 domain-containing protein n=1 Tax=Candidatus Kaiserbacteria bacterium RIFCSPHIGHO2_01_FULL_56_24 TaxID=1798487 RepID=A0A1F6DGN3_9BACT|nr:MAG: hypothetical protein A2765_05295 [Candidatus Kaiserbacteria bacterium RIFCSPHIGHO2_01_FULL_56_24]
MRILLILVLLLIPAGHASAVFYNNTETIEIGDGGLPEPSPDSTEDTGTSGGSGGSSSTGGSSSGVGSSGGSSGGGSSAGSGTTTPSVSGTSGAGDSSDEDDLIDALLAGGALSGVSSSGSASGAAGSAGASAGSNFSVRVIGAKVRQALSADIDLQEILTYWRRGKGRASERDLGLIAASTALRDSNVQEVSFTASSFEIVYRSRGYLVAVLPWSFPVRLTVVPDAPVIEERVRVKLPWYRFFVRKFFTVSGLQRDINELLTKTKNESPDSDIGTPLLFEATAQFLRTKVGTVADSVLLGIEPR